MTRWRKRERERGRSVSNKRFSGWNFVEIFTLKWPLVLQVQVVIFNNRRKRERERKKGRKKRKRDERLPFKGTPRTQTNEIVKRVIQLSLLFFFFSFFTSLFLHFLFFILLFLHFFLSFQDRTKKVRKEKERERDLPTPWTSPHVFSQVLHFTAPT